MFVPITSEINLETGMVLKEIATDQLFEVNEKLPGSKEVWGEGQWRITKKVPANPDRATLALSRVELSMKYFAEIED